MAKFADVKHGGDKALGCPVCGEKNEGTVVLQIKDNTQDPPRVISSRNISFCETHAVDAFTRAKNALQTLGAT